MASSLIGRTVSHYHITAKLGEGGMGEVYRATDTTLEREVALKVLPQAFIADADRLTRFEREARLLAQLNHPNIAQIFGVEHSGETRALVMELVEGPTLAERLEHGPLALEECLLIARQIVDALEEAHEKGIVHRDLKPQNVKASVESKVKVLDFGLAKAMGSSDPSSPASVQASPTLTLGATVAGVILGTAAYMAPEQAKGLAVDKRADIWAFGVVLYEMLVGGRLFAGETVPDTLAGVLRAGIDLGTLPAGTPASLRRLLARCLERNPKNRLRDIGEARIALDAAALEALEAGEGPARADAAAVAPRTWHLRAAAVGAVVALALGGLALALAWPHLAPPRETPLRGRFDVLPPAGATFEVGDGPVTISSDGRRLAFAVRDQQGAGVVVRDVETGVVRTMPHIDGAYEPFWSPDGRTLGFGAAQLMRWDVDSDARPVAIAPLVDGRGASWSPRGVIVFAPGPNAPLQVVPALGGAVRPATVLDPAHAEIGHLRPQFLPDGRHFIYWAQSEHANESALMVGDLDSATSRRLLELAVPARFVAPSTLLFLRGSSLRAQELDVEALVLRGAPTVVAEGVSYLEQYQNPAFSASAGLLAFHSENPATQPALFDRAGRRGASLGASGDKNVDLSPDGARLAVNAVDPVTHASDVWVIDLARNVRTRLTFAPSNEFGPVWSTDGQRIFYVASDGKDSALRATRASGVGGATDLLTVPFPLEPIAAFPDGRHLLLETAPPDSNGDLEVIDLETAARLPFVATPAQEQSGRISPDGRWIAYESAESGREEIYVQPYPPTGQRWQISSGGGGSPRWRADGRELTFVMTGRLLHAVAVSPGPIFGPPTALFRVTGRDYTISRDGTHYYVVAPGEEAGLQPVHVLVGWNLPEGDSRHRGVDAQ